MPSTAVRDIEYDDETETLRLTFVPTGKRYAYRRVPIETYDAFRAAFSKGTFFNQHIRDEYEYEIVEK